MGSKNHGFNRLFSPAEPIASGIFSAIPGNLLLPGTILAFFLGRAFFAGLAACILLVVLSNCAAAKYKQKVQEKLQVTWQGCMTHG